VLPINEHYEKNTTSAEKANNSRRIPRIVDTSPLECQQYHYYAGAEHGEPGEVELCPQYLHGSFVRRDRMIWDMDDKEEDSTNGADWKVDIET
jgi:hypothetical protein